MQQKYLELSRKLSERDDDFINEQHSHRVYRYKTRDIQQQKDELKEQLANEKEKSCESRSLIIQLRKKNEELLLKTEEGNIIIEKLKEQHKHELEIQKQKYEKIISEMTHRIMNLEATIDSK
jgi:hypothetical protein